MFFRVSMFTYYFIYIILFVFLCLHIILFTLFCSCFYVYILICLQCNFFNIETRKNIQRNYNVNKIICNNMETRKKTMYRNYNENKIIAKREPSCFYVYILICLQCNFFIYFFRVSMFTYHCVYIVISLHCFFRAS
jgi:hypothetical protein